LDNARFLQEGFSKLTKDGAIEILRGKEILLENLSTTKDPEKLEKLNHIKALLDEIEQSHIRYDEVLVAVVGKMSEQFFELDFDDTKRIRRQARTLTRKLGELLSELQLSTREAVQDAEKAEQTARKTMWVTLVFSLMFSWGLAYIIIQNISGALKTVGGRIQAFGAGRAECYGALNQ
jgi:hypothetical protein